DRDRRPSGGRLGGADAPRELAELEQRREVDAVGWPARSRDGVPLEGGAGNDRLDDRPGGAAALHLLARPDADDRRVSPVVARAARRRHIRADGGTVLRRAGPTPQAAAPEDAR